MRIPTPLRSSGCLPFPGRPLHDRRSRAGRGLASVASPRKLAPRSCRSPSEGHHPHLRGDPGPVPAARWHTRRSGRRRCDRRRSRPCPGLPPGCRHTGAHIPTAECRRDGCRAARHGRPAPASAPARIGVPHRTGPPPLPDPVPAPEAPGPARGRRSRTPRPRWPVPACPSAVPPASAPGLAATPGRTVTRGPGSRLRSTLHQSALRTPLALFLSPSPVRQPPHPEAAADRTTSRRAGRASAGHSRRLPARPAESAQTARRASRSPHHPSSRPPRFHHGSPAHGAPGPPAPGFPRPARRGRRRAYGTGDVTRRVMPV
ncbi:hypothetical protein HRbin39_01529 [bacterium HR39]|nr:hypothetical protein HRbin39_01529 [bacterium HR39]